MRGGGGRVWMRRRRWRGREENEGEEYGMKEGEWREGE
jgi:hypothetical protein